MKDFIPLFQTFLWVSLTLILVRIFWPEITLLRKILVKRLEEGGSVEIGPVKIGELRAEINSVRIGLDEANEKIAKLFLATMSQPMYENLKKLELGNFGKYEISPGLERELYHLRDIGYIEVESIKAIPKAGVNLSEYVKVTANGKKFIYLRESM